MITSGFQTRSNQNVNSCLFGSGDKTSEQSKMEDLACTIQRNRYLVKQSSGNNVCFGKNSNGSDIVDSIGCSQGTQALLGIKYVT